MQGTSSVPAEVMPSQVMIVSRNIHTSMDLRSYFSQRGISTTATDRFDALASRTPCTAVVVFPDEFPMSGVASSIVDLTERFPRAWVVVVTRHTADFHAISASVSARNRCRLLVLPRPAWGWDLLDRIRKPVPH
jgi:hypothetical protein